MKCKLDENLPLALAGLMQESGHDCETVYSEDIAGINDTGILEKCRQEGRILITLDKDFSDIRTYPPNQNPGIIVLRFARQDKIYLLNKIQYLIELLEKESPENKLWVVNEDRVRIRE